MPPYGESRSVIDLHGGFVIKGRSFVVFVARRSRGIASASDLVLPKNSMNFLTSVFSYIPLRWGVAFLR